MCANTAELSEKILLRYQKAGYDRMDVQNDEIFRFSNRFSEHFVFVFDSLSDLQERWERSHEYLVDVYEAYDGHPDREWNFYAVFLCLESPGSSQNWWDIKREIESRTAYSRKFVLCKEEVDSLPPGRITTDDLGTARPKHTTLVEQWREALKEPLFTRLIECPKSRLEEDCVRLEIDAKRHRK